MIDERCLGDGVCRSKIHPDAEIGGCSLLTGPRTSAGPRAVIRDARLHDVNVGPGATVLDSIVVVEGKPESHRCDAAGRVIVSGAEQPEIATGAYARGCTLINTSVGQESRVVDTWARNAHNTSTVE